MYQHFLNFSYQLTGGPRLGNIVYAGILILLFLQALEMIHLCLRGRLPGLKIWEIFLPILFAVGCTGMIIGVTEAIANKYLFSFVIGLSFYVISSLLIWGVRVLNKP